MLVSYALLRSGFVVSKQRPDTPRPTCGLKGPPAYRPNFANSARSAAARSPNVCIAISISIDMSTLFSVIFLDAGDRLALVVPRRPFGLLRCRAGDLRPAWAVIRFHGRGYLFTCPSFCSWMANLTRP